MAKFKLSQINKALREVQKDLMLGNIPAAAFDMATSGTERCGTSPGEFCGTVACIGGHAALKLDADTSLFVGEADPSYNENDWGKRENMTAKTAKALSPLFYPSNTDADWSKLTPAQAVLAIENYFNHKSNPWKGVIV